MSHSEVADDDAAVTFTGDARGRICPPQTGVLDTTMLGVAETCGADVEVFDDVPILFDRHWTRRLQCCAGTGRVDN